MTSLKIEADVQSTEILFDYDGASLQKPLEDLHAHLTSQAKALMDRTGIKSVDLPTMADLTRKDHEAEAKQKIKLLLADAFESYLWAAECKRTPDKVWRLTMSRLKWIYRQHAP